MNILISFLAHIQKIITFPSFNKLAYPLKPFLVLFSGLNIIAVKIALVNSLAVLFCTVNILASVIGPSCMCHKVIK